MTSVKRLTTLWTQGLSGKEKEDFEFIIRNNTQLLSRLQEILLEKGDEILRNETTEDQYEIPNWQFLQAHRNGQKEMIRVLLKLTEHLN